MKDGRKHWNSGARRPGERKCEPISPLDRVWTDTFYSTAMIGSASILVVALGVAVGTAAGGACRA